MLSITELPLTSFALAGFDRFFDRPAGSAEERRAAVSQHGRLLLLVSSGAHSQTASLVLTSLHSLSIIRGNDYIFRSEEQQHSFNYPVQVGTNSKDTPVKDAQRFNIKVQKDDVSRRLGPSFLSSSRRQFSLSRRLRSCAILVFTEG